MYMFWKLVSPTLNVIISVVANKYTLWLDGPIQKKRLETPKYTCIYTTCSWSRVYGYIQSEVLCMSNRSHLPRRFTPTFATTLNGTYLPEPKFEYGAPLGLFRNQNTSNPSTLLFPSNKQKKKQKPNLSSWVPNTFCIVCEILLSSTSSNPFLKIDDAKPVHQIN